MLLDVLPWDWPQDAATRFHQALTDKSVSDSDRLVAAELAGDLVVMNDSLAVALLGIAGSATARES